jgi:hypothetical protein
MGLRSFTHCGIHNGKFPIRIIADATTPKYVQPLAGVNPENPSPRSTRSCSRCNVYIHDG